MPDKISIMDLTAGQVEGIEQRIGVPVTGWGTDTKSVVELYVLILAAATNKPEAEYRDMKMRDILAMVSLDDADPNP